MVCFNTALTGCSDWLQAWRLLELITLARLALTPVLVVAVVVETNGIFFFGGRCTTYFRAYLSGISFWGRCTVRFGF